MFYAFCTTKFLSVVQGSASPSKRYLSRPALWGIVDPVLVANFLETAHKLIIQFPPDLIRYFNRYLRDFEYRHVWWF